MLFWCLDCYGDLCIALSTAASGSSNYRSQVIRLVLKGPKASIRSGDGLSYQALPFMECLQSLQKAKGFTANGLILDFDLLQSKGTDNSRTCPRERPLLGGEEGTAWLQGQEGWPQHPTGPPHTNTSVCTSRGGGCTNAAHSSLSPAHSALGRFQLAGLQEAWRLVLHPVGNNAVRYNRVCSELVGFCSAAAARIDPTYREDKTCLPSLLLFGK